MKSAGQLVDEGVLATTGFALLLRDHFPELGEEGGFADMRANGIKTADTGLAFYAGIDFALRCMVLLNHNTDPDTFVIRMKAFQGEVSVFLNETVRAKRGRRA